MLILTRKIGESLLIGDDVEITVLSIRGSQVKLGVKAPKEISVHRKEIYQRIKALAEQQSDVETQAKLVLYLVNLLESSFLTPKNI